MKFFVYIIEIDNSQFYIGSTNNLLRRLKEHKQGNHAGTKYAKRVKLLLAQEYPSNLIARKVEKKLKSFKSRKIIEKIVNDGKIVLA